MLNGVNHCFEHLPGGVMVCRDDVYKSILYVNRHLLDLFDCDSKEEFLDLTGGCYSGVVPTDRMDIVGDDLSEWEFLKKESGDYGYRRWGNAGEYGEKGGIREHLIYRVRTKRGRSLLLECYGHKEEDPQDGNKLVYLFMPVNIEMISRNLDSITGINSRHRIVERMEEKRLKAMGEHQMGVAKKIIFFDIFRFKLYNMTYGMKKGDQCLRNIACIIQNVFETEYAAHFSDDHFVVFYDGDRELEKVRMVHDLVERMNPDFKLKVKAGIYDNQDNVRIALGCELAKAACDKLKDDNDAIYNYYTNDIRTEAELEKYIIDNIDTAIEKGYIKVYYQPVVRTLSGRLCSVEALSRWIDPEYGMISPDVFVAALEKNHLSYKLDTFVLLETARNLRSLIDMGKEVVPVSFNLSRTDFISMDPNQLVKEILSVYELPRDLFCVEITETTVIKRKDLMGKKIDEFHRDGFEVWMDDFGSGYSSLNMLKDLELDKIKIDMMFLQDMNKRSMNIITSIVDMAKRMGIQTLAEGVESEEQLEFLRSIGCEKIQGFYYGRPQPLDELLNHLDEKQISSESRGVRRFYEKVGRVNLITEEPTALILDNGETFKVMYANQNFYDTISSREEEEARSKAIALAAAANRNRNREGAENKALVPPWAFLEENQESLKKYGLSVTMPVKAKADGIELMSEKFRSLAKAAAKSGSNETMTFVDRDQYYRLSMEQVAAYRNLQVLLAKVYDLADDLELRSSARIDYGISNIRSII